MPRSVPEDDMMDAQQEKDLGHATKAPPDAMEAHVRRTPAAGFSTLIPPDREIEARQALLRAAYPPGRRSMTETRNAVRSSVT